MGRAKGRFASNRPELVLGSSLLLATPALLRLPVTHDSVWQMWIARQMIHGVALYDQIVEVNPPLWFWMAMPLAWIAERCVLSGAAVTLGATIGLIWIATLLLMLLERDEPEGRRWAIYGASFAAMVVLAVPVVTQREHLALIGAIPYTALIARRQAKRPVPPVLATAVGLLAALAFALKPFFALVPIALEAWSYRSTARVRAETLVLASAATAYVLAIALFAPAYLTTTAPIVAIAYPHFTAATLGGFILPILLFALGAFALAGRRQSDPYLVAALAFLLAFLLQGKGWGYHALPALGLLLVALVVALRGSPWRDAAAAAAIAVMLVGSIRTYQPDRRLALISEPEGATVAILSVSTLPLWPLVERRRYRWPLRTFSLWTLPAILAEGPDSQRLATTLRAEVLEDLVCAPPDVLVFDRQGAFDMRGWFAVNRDLDRFFDDYRLWRRVREFDIYRRVADPAPAPGDCRPIY